VEDAVAVGLGLGRDRRADGAAGAAAIVDDELLAPKLAELLEQDAADGVGTARRRIGDHHLDRPRGVFGRTRGGAAHEQRQRAYRLQQPSPRQIARVLHGSILLSVIAGPDPAIHLFRKKMDARVKPADDEIRHACPLSTIAEAPYFGDGENSGAAGRAEKAQARSGQALAEGPGTADARQGGAAGAAADRPGA